LCVDKLRGVKYRDGYHDFVIDIGGIVAFPRLVAAEHSHAADPVPLGSGLAQLDQLLSGGLPRGTSALFVGAPGTGKSALAAQYAIAAAARGERAVIYTYEEAVAVWLRRARAFGQDPDTALATGNLEILRVDPADFSPGQLAAQIHGQVENGCRLVVLDSLHGYLQSVPDDKSLLLHLQELLAYLGRRGTTTLIAATSPPPVDVSHLADSLLALSRHSIAVVKKRGGRHERTARAWKVSDGGVEVGEPVA
jgi:circadian clock protein KaiC